jgi:hypothetical protein
MSTVQTDMTCWEHTQTFAASAATTIKEGAVEAGTWIANGAVHVVTWLKNVWLWIQDNGINCAIWIKDSVASGARSVWQAAGRAYDAAFPFIMSVAEGAKKYTVQTYSKVREFVQAHPNETIVGISAFAAGIFVTILIQQFCCR